MNRDAILRRLEDLHNELAHVRVYPQHYASYTEALSRRVFIVGQIRQLLDALNTAQHKAA